MQETLFAPRKVGEKVQSTDCTRSFDSLRLKEFPYLKNIEKITEYRFNKNPVSSLEGLVTMPNLRALRLENTEISTFYGAKEQPSLEVVNLKNTPVSLFPYYNIMAAVVFGSALKVIDGKPLSPNEYKIAQSLRPVIQEELRKGMIITCLSPVRLFDPKTHGRSLKFQQKDFPILGSQSEYYNKMTRSYKVKDNSQGSPSPVFYPRIVSSPKRSNEKQQTPTSSPTQNVQPQEIEQPIEEFSPNTDQQEHNETIQQPEETGQVEQDEEQQPQEEQIPEQIEQEYQDEQVLIMDNENDTVATKELDNDSEINQNQEIQPENEETQEPEPKNEITNEIEPTNEATQELEPSNETNQELEQNIETIPEPEPIAQDATKDAPEPTLEAEIAQDTQQESIETNDENNQNNEDNLNEFIQQQGNEENSGAPDQIDEEQLNEILEGEE